MAHTQAINNVEYPPPPPSRDRPTSISQYVRIFYIQNEKG
jgi:hypothetical protein